jgi:hypothetical protein
MTAVAVTIAPKTVHDVSPAHAMQTPAAIGRSAIFFRHEYDIPKRHMLKRTVVPGTRARMTRPQHIYISIYIYMYIYIYIRSIETTMNNMNDLMDIVIRMMKQRFVMIVIMIVGNHESQCRAFSRRYEDAWAAHGSWKHGS